jgi:Bacterial PH domain
MMGMATKSSTAQRVFRQRSSVWLAVLSSVTAVLLLLSLVRSWAQYPRPVFGAWVLFGVAVAWSIFVRPSVVINAQGVTIKNIVRDIHIPWAALTDVSTRWNLKVMAGDQGYNAWAISSQVDRPRSASSGLFRIPVSARSNRVGSAATSPSPAATKVTARAVAESIQRAKQEYDDAVEAGEIPREADTGVRIVWLPLIIAVLLLLAAAVVVFSFV